MVAEAEAAFEQSARRRFIHSTAGLGVSAAIGAILAAVDAADLPPYAMAVPLGLAVHFFASAVSSAISIIRAAR